MNFLPNLIIIKQHGMTPEMEQLFFFKKTLFHKSVLRQKHWLDCNFPSVVVEINVLGGITAQDVLQNVLDSLNFLQRKHQ